jgi:hypothetical protein
LHPSTFSQVEEQKRRAEADKLAALTALEKRSREFMREKEEKRALEAKITAMQVSTVHVIPIGVENSYRTHSSHTADRSPG